MQYDEEAKKECCQVREQDGENDESKNRNKNEERKIEGNTVVFVEVEGEKPL